MLLLLKNMYIFLKSVHFYFVKQNGCCCNSGYHTGNLFFKNPNTNTGLHTHLFKRCACMTLCAIHYNMLFGKSKYFPWLWIDLVCQYWLLNHNCYNMLNRIAGRWVHFTRSGEINQSIKVDVLTFPEAGRLFFMCKTQNCYNQKSNANDDA